MIRPLRREDREPLKVLVAATGMFTGEEVAIALELIDAVLDAGGQKDYIIRVSESDGNVEGYYCVGPTPATEGTFDLYWIAVDTDFQEKGAGSKLLGFLEDAVKAMGGRMILADTSTVPVYEKTRKFYLKNGFEEVARVPDYYYPGNDRITFCRRLA